MCGEQNGRAYESGGGGGGGGAVRLSRVPVVELEGEIGGATDLDRILLFTEARKLRDDATLNRLLHEAARGHRYGHEVVRVAVLDDVLHDLKTTTTR